MSKPVYDLIGLKVLSINYSRESNTKIESFEIKILHHGMAENENVYSMILSLSLNFPEEVQTVFCFAAGFAINDMKWKNDFPKDMLNSLFLSVVFPYIRQKVYAITDDSLGAVVLPVIDLRGKNLSEGAKYTLTKQKLKKKPTENNI